MLRRNVPVYNIPQTGSPILQHLVKIKSFRIIQFFKVCCFTQMETMVSKPQEESPSKIQEPPCHSKQCCLWPLQLSISGLCNLQYDAIAFLNLLRDHLRGLGALEATTSLAASELFSEKKTIHHHQMIQCLDQHTRIRYRQNSQEFPINKAKVQRYPKFFDHQCELKHIVCSRYKNNLTSSILSNFLRAGRLMKISDLGLEVITYIINNEYLSHKQKLVILIELNKKKRNYLQFASIRECLERRD